MTTYDSTTVYDAATLTYDGNPAGLANLPVVGVFIAFDDGPYVAEPNWVEVTDYVREVSIRRGRQDDLQQFPAGQASVTLDNRARLFDPFNTSSTYNGKLKPRRQIKIVGQWAGVNYPLFRGFVAGWPVEYSEGGKDSTVTIDCFDLLGLMATEVLPPEWINKAITALNPVLFFPCTETNGSTAITEYTGKTPLTNFYSAGLNELVETPSQFEGIKSSALFVQRYDSRATISVTTRVNFSLSGVVQFLSGSTYLSPIGTIAMQYGDTRIGLRYQYRTVTSGATTYDATRFFVFWEHNGDVTQTTRTVDIAGSPSQAIHFVITYNAASDVCQLWINGEQRVLSSITGLAADAVPAGQRWLFAINCAISNVCVFDKILTAGQSAALHDFAASRVVESSSSRFDRLLAETQVPALLETYEGTPQATLSEIGGTTSIVNEIQKAVLSENGELFVSPTGVLTFVARDYWAFRARSNTSQVDFTDTGTGVYYDANAIRVDINADQVRNDVNVEFTSGGQVASADSSSIAEFGAANSTVSTYLSSPTQAQTLADYIVSIYSQPKIRVEPFLVKGQRNPAYDWPRLLALDLLDRFTFVRTPSVGSAINKPMLLQSIEHRFTPGTWETTINGSARYTGWFIVGVSDIGGEDVLL